VLHLEELRATRTQWYEAYVAGDTRRLAELEDAAFFVVSEAGIEAGAERLASIASAVRAGRWFPAGSRTLDAQLELHAVSDGIVSARGLGRIATPRGELPTVLFTELWQRSTQGWRALHLHYHPQPRP
jgi:ketosteroid isomerase-like protein